MFLNPSEPGCSPFHYQDNPFLAERLCNSHKLGQVELTEGLVYSDCCHLWGNRQSPPLSHHLLQQIVVLLVLKTQLKENSLLTTLWNQCMELSLALSKSDTSYPDLVQAPRVKGRVPKTMPRLQTSIPRSRTPGLSSLLLDLVTNQRFHDCLLGFNNVLERLTELRETLHALLLVYYVLIKDAQLFIEMIPFSK